MKKGDKIAALLIICFIIISFLGSYMYKKQFKSHQSIAVIKQDGKIIKSINLKQVKAKEEFKINYKDNNYNIIAVEPGKIRFVDANCPDKLCVKEGWISEPGQIVVCLPHRLMIEIEGDKSQIDEVTY